jgi:hypothetical protein
MTQVKQDYDNPWKEAVTEHFRLFAEFLLDWVARDIDWENAPVSLEQELRKAHPDVATGKGLVDCFLRLHKKGGELRFLHVEVQGQWEDDLPHRVWVYNKKGTEVVGHEVVTIVLLVDSNPLWRPNVYHYEEWRCKKTFEYPVVKLLDWQGREEELASHSNPFALFVLGHLWSQQTVDDMERRLELKLRLISLLLERKLDEAGFASWSRLFDWQLQLPRDGERRVMEWLGEKRREGKMPFVSVFEKLAREEVREEALKEGRSEGLKEGRNEGLKEGRNEGLKEGRSEGELRGLRRGALAALKGKFGPAGAALEPRLAEAGAVALESVLTAVETDRPLEEIERLLPAAE